MIENMEAALIVNSAHEKIPLSGKFERMEW